MTFQDFFGSEGDVAKLLPRPKCPECGMNMLAAGPEHDGKRTFECLRCGHNEEKKLKKTS